MGRREWRDEKAVGKAMRELVGGEEESIQMSGRRGSLTRDINE